MKRNEAEGRKGKRKRKEENGRKIYRKLAKIVTAAIAFPKTWYDSFLVGAAQK